MSKPSDLEAVLIAGRKLRDALSSAAELFDGKSWEEAQRAMIAVALWDQTMNVIEDPGPPTEVDRDAVKGVLMWLGVKNPDAYLVP